MSLRRPNLLQKGDVMGRCRQERHSHSTLAFEGLESQRLESKLKILHFMNEALLSKTGNWLKHVKASWIYPDAQKTPTNDRWKSLEIKRLKRTTPTFCEGQIQTLSTTCRSEWCVRKKKPSHYEPQHPPCAVTRHLEWLGRLQWVVVIHCDALWYAVICCDCGSMESNSFAIIRQGPPRLVSFCHQRLRWDESRGCCWPFFCHYVLDSVVKTAKTCTWFMWEHCGVSRKARGSIWLNH